MLAYIIRRLLQGIFVVLGISAIVFFLLSISGDPVALMLGPEATQEDMQRLREAMGLNRSLPERYLLFLSHVTRGDFGKSIAIGIPALDLVLSRLPATFELTLAALLFSTSIALPLGIIAAIRHGSALDKLSMLITFLGQSIPVFWLGLMLILLFAVNLQWFPTGGRGTLGQMVLPIFTLGLFSMARTARLVRSAMLEVLRQDYIRTARAKGLPERTVVLRHGLRNALIPVITIVGLDFSTLIGGAVITETIFAWPGVGRLVVDSVRSRDFPVVQAAVFIIASVIVLINIVVDVLYVYVNPMVRYR